VAFSDHHGLMVADVQDGQARRLMKHVEGTHSEGMDSLGYGPDVWSPEGRWLLVSEGQYEGSERLILDTLTGEIRRVPDSVVCGWCAISERAWTADGSTLIQLRSDGGPGSPGLLRLSTDSTGDSEDTPPDWSTAAGSEYFDLHVAPDGAVRFGLLDAGVYLAAPGNSEPSRLMTLPPPDPKLGSDDRSLDDRRLFWSADGRAAVYRNGGPGAVPVLVMLQDGGRVGARVIDATAELRTAVAFGWAE
jgi:hypothetical protein